MNEELNHAQICITSLTKTSREKFHPYLTYNPPQIKGCQQVEIWYAANEILGSKWTIKETESLAERPI